MLYCVSLKAADLAKTKTHDTSGIILSISITLQDSGRYTRDDEINTIRTVTV